MFVKKKYKRNLDSIIKYLDKNDGKPLFITSAPNISFEKLTSVGLNPINGENIIPHEFGRFTNFNLNGKFVVRKDLPKEMRVVRTVLWEWNEFHGRNDRIHRSEYRDITRMCYPREFVKPPLEPIIFNIKNLCITSLPIDKDNSERLLHVVNMFLEIFPEGCNITSDIDQIIPTKMVNWEILPPGEYPYERLNKTNKSNKINGNGGFVKDRFKKLESYNPTARVIGISSFRNYVAFEFKDKGLTFLESETLDNATYIFDKDWEECSKLTKAQVLNGRLCINRIIHTKDWFKQVENILGENSHKGL